jgi:small subunit ribosomal protein S20
VQGKDAAAAGNTLQEATRALSKAVGKGVLHRNNASRRISRLTSAVAQLGKSAG